MVILVRSTQCASECASVRTRGSIPLDLAVRGFSKLAPMLKRSGVGGLLALTAVLGIACDGERFLAVEGPYRKACDSQADCGNGEHPLGLECIRNVCDCPREGDVLCCARDEAPCERHCRPASECAAPAPGVECQTAADCMGRLQPDTRCATVECSDQKCKLKIRRTPPTQRIGDCTVITCDADGKAHEDEDPSDVYDDANQCTRDRCDGMNPVNEPLEAGTAPDGSGYCDGKGHRVECLVDEHCADPAIGCSPRGRCVSTSCKNGVKDTLLGETAIDCGGLCDPCAAGQACNIPSDCKDGLCASNGKCALPKCDDGIQNGAETSRDCGGPACNACSAPAACRIGDDCDSGVCLGGQCQPPTCSDGVMNDAETAVDYGAKCPKDQNSTEPT